MSNNDVLNVYAAYSKNNELRLASSSGAVFSVLSESVLQCGGIVYGVSMSQDCRFAEFVRIDKQECLFKLRGSKYLQAKVGDTFRCVKADLEAGLIVLFSGTSCQINALEYFLGKKYDNLCCVDIICHGVPSPKLWRKYAEYVEKKNDSKLLYVNFRCKDDSWYDFGMKKMDSNHNAYYVSKNEDPYMIMFLRNYCLRPSCYNCYAKKQKLADITIADFWGVNHVAPEMNDGKGVSLVLIRTEKGKKLFGKLDLVVKHISYEEGVRNNPAEYCSVDRPQERNFFFNDLNIMGFDELREKYAIPSKITIKRKMKKLIKKVFALILKKSRGGNSVSTFDYGLLFILEMEHK